MNNDEIRVPGFMQNYDSAKDSRTGPISDTSQEDSWNDKRVFVHIDLNSFYPSCEELRSPELVGKPHAVIMTHDEQGQITKGVVASCSYEAKKLGVKSAMSLAFALKICPNLILNRVDIPYYSTISEKVMCILHEYSNALEQTSIDEAYLDCSDKIHTQVMHGARVTSSSDLTLLPRHSKRGSESVRNMSYLHLVEEFARSIKNRIRTECGLLTSVGVAPTKSIAKIASDFQKPDGLTVVSPTMVPNFLESLEVERISGIGTKTKESLKEMGIETIGELASTDVQTLVHKFGNKYGIRIWKIAKGLDEDPVRPKGEHVSLSTEYTLPDFTKDQQILLSYFNALADELFNRIQKRGYRFRTIGIKLVHADFVVETRERSYLHHQETKQSINNAIPGLLQKFYSAVPEKREGQVVDDLRENSLSTSDTKLVVNVPIRKIGIKISNLILARGYDLDHGQSRILDYF